jgi:hypothetical protein
MGSLRVKNASSKLLRLGTFKVGNTVGQKTYWKAGNKVYVLILVYSISMLLDPDMDPHSQYGSGFKKANLDPDPQLWLLDPDPDPDPGQSFQCEAMLFRIQL